MTLHDFTPSRDFLELFVHDPHLGWSRKPIWTIIKTAELLPSGDYRLVMTHIAMESWIIPYKRRFLVGQISHKWAMFRGYVKLPEGNIAMESSIVWWENFHYFDWAMFNGDFDITRRYLYVTLLESFQPNQPANHNCCGRTSYLEMGQRRIDINSKIYSSRNVFDYDNMQRFCFFCQHWWLSPHHENMSWIIQSKTVPQMLHVWNIYLHLSHKCPNFVGKYTSTMEHLGTISEAPIWRPLNGP